MTPLRQAVQDYLSVRRALGYKLEREGSLLPDFVDYLAQSASQVITSERALEWATQPAQASPKWWAKRLGMVRGFAQYVRAIEPTTEVPSAELLPYRSTRLTPYLYSDADVRALMSACERLHGSLKPFTYSTLIGLLAVTGMRVGEAIALNRFDVYEREQLIVVRGSKFGKSRELPLHETTIQALQAYANQRDRNFPSSRSLSFFVSQAATRLLYQNVHWTFLRLVHWAGLAERRPHRPRIHDLRHSFAVKAILGWYREGLDVEPRLNWLSTYLGHVSPASTYWYLTGTPELLSLAARRLDQALGGLR